MSFIVKPIGIVRSKLKRLKEAPRFYTEGAPNAWIDVRPGYVEGLLRMRAGDEVVVLTWLHKARRKVLRVHPRGNRSNPLTGVFSTRSPDRPNPIGLHRAKILKIDSHSLMVDAIEVIDGTPVLDIKPVVRSKDH